MRTVVMERRCPKCGGPLYLLPEGCATNWGVKTCPVICERCGHVEEAAFDTGTRHVKA